MVGKIFRGRFQEDVELRDPEEPLLNLQQAAARLATAANSGRRLTHIINAWSFSKLRISVVILMAISQ